MLEPIPTSLVDGGSKSLTLRPGTHSAFYLYLITCALLGAATLIPSPIAIGASALLGLSAPLMILCGVLIHRPNKVAPWFLMAASTATAVVASLARGGGGDDAAGWAGHLLATSAYLLVGMSLILILRARCTGPGFPGAILDGTMFTTAISLLVWVEFVVPALDRQPEHTGALTAIYPVLSGVIVFLVVQLALTRVTHLPAFRLIGTGLSLVLVGDIGYAANAAAITSIDPITFDLIYLVGALLGGLAALHPSMIRLTDPSPMPVERFSRLRIATLGVALGIPSLIVLAHGPSLPVERIPVAVGGLIIVCVVTARVVEAVTHFARSQEDLAYAATHDSLTGLPNRNQLLSDLERTVGGNHGGVALLFCDLDRFKFVNDTWGHAVGDQLLILVAERLQRAAANLGATVARIGGDEFVVVGDPIPTPEHASRFAEDVLSYFDDQFHLSVGSYHIRPSVGISHCAPGAVEPAADLIRNADTAMYVAKHSGTHISLFDTTMRDAVVRRLQLENELHGAADRGELTVHYQPVVEIDTGKISSFEALVRWNHPTRGLIPPIEFIPVSEETGTIIEIGEFVLAEAVSTLGRWWARDPQNCPQIAVNASATQLRDTEFADLVERLLDQHGVPPHRLCVEITETVILDGSTSTIEQLEAISSLGVVIAADDFGTGYSSLSYLKRYPVNRVKLDREFVWGLDAEGGPRPDDVAIVDAVLAMASALGLGVVAEGVETAEQREHLRLRGCRWAQGWLFSKAVPLDAAEALIGTQLPH